MECEESWESMEAGEVVARERREGGCSFREIALDLPAQDLRPAVLSRLPDGVPRMTTASRLSERQHPCREQH